MKLKSTIIVIGVVLFIIVALFTQDARRNFAYDGPEERQLVLLQFLCLFAVASAILSALLTKRENMRNWISDFLQGLSTEMIGALVTGLILILFDVF